MLVVFQGAALLGVTLSCAQFYSIVPIIRYFAINTGHGVLIVCVAVRSL